MAKEILSIRLSADGLSFWTNGLEGKKGENNLVNYQTGTDGRTTEESVYDRVSDYRGILKARGMELPAFKRVYADTLSAVLVPVEIFEERDAGIYMAIHGFGPERGYYTVCSKPVYGTVAVMKLYRPAIEALGKQLGEFEVAHLLQYNLLTEQPDIKGCRVRVYISIGLCHITAFNNSGMAMAESYPYSSLADIQYYINCIMQTTAISPDSPVYICGDRAEENTATLSRSFKNALCG